MGLGGAQTTKSSGTPKTPAKTTPSTKATSPPAAATSAKAPSKSAKKKSTKGRTARARAQKAPTPDRIREIQSALAKAGHYSGEPTGKWDAGTIAAMKGFQEAQGLKPTGKVDAQSLQKLGLGSRIAGAAPPRPATAPTDPKSNP